MQSLLIIQCDYAISLCDGVAIAVANLLVAYTIVFACEGSPPKSRVNASCHVPEQLKQDKNHPQKAGRLFRTVSTQGSGQDCPSRRPMLLI